jgi:phosphate transport system protein
MYLITRIRGRGQVESPSPGITGVEMRELELRVAELVQRVVEVLAGATEALLGQDAGTARRLVAEDEWMDARSSELGALVWSHLDETSISRDQRHELIRFLQVLPELERSADLAEHIAQRAITGLGGSMTPVSRGIVQRMGEVAVEMWRTLAKSYVEHTKASQRPSIEMSLREADEELDILRDRLIMEAARGTMPPREATQMPLIGRFYERLGDHAVNLGYRASRP